MDWPGGSKRKSKAASTTAVVILLALAVSLLGAGSAGAVVVQLPNGHVLGITPRAGLAPSSIPGARRSARPHVIDNGNVVYQGGPVVHSSAPYLIFWDPSSAIPAATKTLMTRYFTDVAHDSSLATNVYGVLRQYSDQTGIADYQQMFSPATQVLVDTNPYPARDTTNCPNVAAVYYPRCITDTQIQAQLTAFIGEQTLPEDGLTSASELAANAPIYFMVTPANVNVCAQGGSPAVCADNSFCAYHSSYTDGANNVLYSPIPLLPAENLDPNLSGPKSCQFDNDSAVQEPNGSLADVALKYLSHEDSETITDPLGTGWWDTNGSGNEVGDSCNYWDGGPADPANGDNPNAFEPTLGGSASGGTLYDQLINGDQYYLQSEWSNGSVGCRMQPSTDTLTPSFTAPAGVAIDTSAGFDPTTTASTGGYSSIAWDFGDGTTSFASTATTSNLAPATVSHLYSALGTYTVTLTVVDRHGNVATTTHDVNVGNAPSAAFTASSLQAPVGTSLSFDGSGSSDPNNPGGLIQSWSWSFGDGGTATGATAAHTYSTGGAHTVTLTVTDTLGITSSVSKQVEILAGPNVAFAFSPTAALPGQAVTFTATAVDPNVGGSISSYSWSFGDGAAATGATASHAFAAPGAYTVGLTATDSFGLTMSAVHVVSVSAAVTPPPPSPVTPPPPSPGKPTSAGGSVSGVGKRKPKLSFAVAAGTDAPGLTKIVIGLRGGLGFAKKGLAKGVSVRSAAGQRLSFADKLSAGTLTVTLGSAAGAVKLTIGGRALTASGQLAHRVKRGKLHTLSLALTAIDSAGTQTPLTVALRV